MKTHSLEEPETVDGFLDQLEELLEQNSDSENQIRLSLYIPGAILPKEEESIFTNAMHRARLSLKETNGINDESREQIEKNLRRFFESGPADRSHKGGMAVFADRKQIRCLKFEQNFPSFSVCSHHWFLTPILALGASLSPYFLLALSQNSVHLYRGSLLGFRETTPEEMPKSLSESNIAQAKIDGDSPDADIPPIDKEILAKFFSQIDKIVIDEMATKEGPLIIAGVEFYLPIFQSITTNPRFTGKIIPGNHEFTKSAELHGDAIKMLRPDFISSRKKLLIRLRKLECTSPDLFVGDPDKLLLSAFMGRVKTVVLPTELKRFGRFDEQSGKIEETSHTDIEAMDLFQKTAELVIQNGGEVFYLDSLGMPSGHSACGELRF